MGLEESPRNRKKVVDKSEKIEGVILPKNSQKKKNRI